MEITVGWQFDMQLKFQVEFDGLMNQDKGGANGKGLFSFNRLYEIE